LRPSSTVLLFSRRTQTTACSKVSEKKFDTLLRRLQGQGKITEKNIEEALRDVRLALLEADVNVGVVKSFIEGVGATRSVRRCSGASRPSSTS